MTAGIPSDAGRVEPAYGWAAVAPDGTVAIKSIRLSELGARNYIGARFAFPQELLSKAVVRGLRAGWRVIRVQINPAGEREEKS